MLNNERLSKSVFNNGKRREPPGLWDTTKAHIDRVQSTKIGGGLFDGRIHENECEGFSVAVICGYDLQDFQLLEGCECLENEGVNELDWEGDILNLVEPAQMNSEQRLEAANVPWCWHESRWKAEFKDGQIREGFESEDHWNISAMKLEGEDNLHKAIAVS